MLVGLIGMMDFNANASTYANGPKIKDVKLSLLSDEVNNNGTQEFKLVIIVKGDDKDEVANVAVELEATGNAPTLSTSKVIATFKKNSSTTNKKRYVNKDITFSKDALGQEYNIKLTMMDENGKTIGSAINEKVTAENDGKATNAVDKVIDDKESNPDSCDTKYKLKELGFTTTNSGGLYIIKFDFNLEKGSDVPTKTKMVMQLTNCNGQTNNIQITLKYDESTFTCSGSQAIKQDKDCPWILTYCEIGLYNPCRFNSIHFQN